MSNRSLTFLSLKYNNYFCLNDNNITALCYEGRIVNKVSNYPRYWLRCDENIIAWHFSSLPRGAVLCLTSSISNAHLRTSCSHTASTLPPLSLPAPLALLATVQRTRLRTLGLMFSTIDRTCKVHRDPRGRDPFHRARWEVG